MDGNGDSSLSLRLTKLPADGVASRGIPAPMEFHISRFAREKYRFDEALFGSSGNVIFASFHAVRLFVQRYNERVDLVRFPERALRTGQVNAMGLIDEILHYVVQLYREAIGVDPFREIDAELTAALGGELEGTLLRFVTDFPPLAVHRGVVSPSGYLAGATKGRPNREIALEELLLLWVANANPAFAQFKELFGDEALAATTAYSRVIAGMREHFERKPGFGPDGQSLIEMLRSPAAASPFSLSGQLRFIRERWGMLLGSFLLRLLGGLDVMKEEERLAFGGPGPSEVYTFSPEDSEREKFSQDREWMPKVMLIAKSALVWLDQLSRAYGRAIGRLDGIPDQELDALRERGFTALWLIGIWERSGASKRIKQLCGNPEAEASAYSLRRYAIAPDLGGWEALDNLRERCASRGIRLASDMVPNHTGIDSTWVLDHPERFVQVSDPPFPSYSYSGESLSPDPRIGIYLEDHYFDKTDAAVTFKRADFASGDVRYIYHGNDGTHMPWNDTAQLNFLDPWVREAVIRKIVHVARNFPIIRFDAAMTLAKRHIQRLWFPEPGSGGAIPSRSEHAMPASEFDRAIPSEFWREVVDRVAAEAPDTLLLAEAFWMMESYFVRSLGIHRVYNSAFMNMLKDEENAKYRQTVKNTLEFDPEILKRFVNFMNNPDEETAVVQFGRGDKYFGVCTLMVTMPGLPMFGHGQIEGFAEKYGMEYRRAYREEHPDEEMVRRHEREIFPLMKRRYLFAEVSSFVFYDFFAPSGAVDENVFAYSNRAGEEQALVLYNNRMERTSGWIKDSVPRTVKEPDGSKRSTRAPLAQALGLRDEDGCYAVLVEQRSGLTYLRSSRELWAGGLHAELQGYESQVFLSIREVRDNDLGHYRRLCEVLAGRGARDLDAALKGVFLEPLHRALSRVLRPASVGLLLSPGAPKETGAFEDYRAFLRCGCDFSSGSYYGEESVEALRKTASSIREIMASGFEDAACRSYLETGLELNPRAFQFLGCWALLKGIGAILPGDRAERSRSLIDEWMLDDAIAASLRELEVTGLSPDRQVLLVKLLVAEQDWFRLHAAAPDPARAMSRIFADEDARAFLGENRFKEILWFGREAYLDLAWWLFMAAAIGVYEDTPKGEARREAMSALSTVIRAWLAALDTSEYQVERLIAALRAEPRPESSIQ